MRAAREAIGPDGELFVDANGAYDRKQALALAERSPTLGVRWFEEPVTLRRSRRAARCCATARRPGWRSPRASTATTCVDFRRMLEAGAVDVLQADATRCAGSPASCGAARSARRARCRSRRTLRAVAARARVLRRCRALRHLEYFHDHVRIEHMLFDGALEPRGGALHPDLARPGSASS